MMPYLSISLFDTKLIGLDVSNLAQPIFGSGSQSYEGYWVSIEDHPLSVSWEEYPMYSWLDKSMASVIRIEIERVLWENLIRTRLD